MINFYSSNIKSRFLPLVVLILSAGCDSPGSPSSNSRSPHQTVQEMAKKSTESAQQQDSGKIKKYNTLGRTGLKVSEIGLGAGGLTDPVVVEYALDKGINYFDTAEGYANGKSESAIGQVAARRRTEMIIATKLELNGKTTQEEIFRRVDESLKRLQSTTIDILMIHGGNRDAVDNPEIYAAFDKLKEEGKIRFTGISTHAPNLADEVRYMVDANKVDVILCTYDPITHRSLPDILKTAKSKGIGLVGMKMITAARKANLEEVKSKKFPLHLAAIRWALQTSGMDVLIPSINIMDQVDEYLTVSGSAQQ